MMSCWFVCSVWPIFLCCVRFAAPYLSSLELALRSALNYFSSCPPLARILPSACQRPVVKRGFLKHQTLYIDYVEQITLLSVDKFLLFTSIWRSKPSAKIWHSCIVLCGRASSSVAPSGQNTCQGELSEWDLMVAAAHFCEICWLVMYKYFLFSNIFIWSPTLFLIEKIWQ